MGENMKRRQAEQFRYSHDKAYDRLKEGDLFAATRPELFAKEYRCILAGTAVLSPGDQVLLSNNSLAHEAVVVVGNDTIGAVANADQGLTEALINRHGLLLARVQSVSKLTSAFIVRLEPAA